MARDEMDEAHDYVPKKGGAWKGKGRRRDAQAQADAAPQWVCPLCGRPIERVHSWMWWNAKRAHITCPGAAA